MAGGYRPTPTLGLNHVSPKMEKRREPSFDAFLNMLAQAQVQFYTAPGGSEGSFTRACLMPGIAHWKLQSNQVFVSSFNPAGVSELVRD